MVYRREVGVRGKREGEKALMVRRDGPGKGRSRLTQGGKLSLVVRKSV